LAQAFFHHFGFQQAFHGHLDVLEQFVDDVVVAHIHARGIGSPLGTGGHGGIETNDHSTRRCREVDVRFCDLAWGGEQHPHLNFALGQLFEGSQDGFHGTLHIRLEDEVEFLEIAFAGLAGHRGQGNPA
jgi:hypothetical protein